VNTVELKLVSAWGAISTGTWTGRIAACTMRRCSVLMALNAAWEGGDLLLRRNGVVTHTDLRPRVIPEYPEDNPGLGAVAFTDAEHHAEPVKDGVRMVLHIILRLLSKGKRSGNRERQRG
jgi:hypothetical protein